MNYEKSLRVLLTNALSSVYEKELAKNNESDIGSRKHYRKMSRILALSLTASGALVNVRRRALIAILVAAALLLVGGTGIVFADEISKIMREIYEDRMVIVMDDINHKSKIEERYVSAYLEENYHLRWSHIYQQACTYQWENEKGYSIRFTQYASVTPEYSATVDKGASKDIKRNNNTYCFQKGPSLDSIFWNYDGYHFSMSFTPIPEEELFRIIDSIVLTEDPPPS